MAKNRKRTKIVATLGPACSTKEIIEEMMEAGVNVFRVNFSHAEYDDVANKIKIIREINKRRSFNVAILVDLQGPKLRVGVMGEKVKLKEGDSFTFTTDKCEGDSEKAYMTYQNFPKDVKALTKIAEENGYTAELITAVEQVNDAQKLVIAKKIIKRFGEDLTGFTFGIWGLAFKPGTDDMREAPAIYVIKELVSRGAKIKAYDPKAIDEAKAHYLKGVQNITYLDSKYDVLKDSDALVLLTEWKEFRSPDFEEMKTQLKTSVIFDGRNQYNTFNLEEKGFEYYQIGKK